MWLNNIDQEMDKISDLIEKGFTWIAMDTEFPGIYFSTVVEQNQSEMMYRMLKMNVDNL